MHLSRQSASFVTNNIPAYRLSVARFLEQIQTVIFALSLSVCLSISPSSPTHLPLLLLFLSLNPSLPYSSPPTHSSSLTSLPLSPLPVSVLAVKTKTIPAWDETLAARVRDGMTLQGECVRVCVVLYTTHTYSTKLHCIQHKCKQYTYTYAYYTHINTYTHTTRHTTLTYIRTCIVQYNSILNHTNLYHAILHCITPHYITV